MDRRVTKRRNDKTCNWPQGLQTRDREATVWCDCITAWHSVRQIWAHHPWVRQAKSQNVCPIMWSFTICCSVRGLGQ